MTKLKNIFDHIKLNKIKTYLVGKKILIIDRQTIFSVMKNYSAIKILENKNKFDVSILTDLKNISNILEFYKHLGFKKFTNSFKIGYLITFPFISIKIIFHLLNYFKYLLNNNFEKFINSYEVSGIIVGDIIYDRYIRNDYSFLKPSFFEIKLIKIFLYTVFKVYWIENYLKKKNINLIIINTHVYSNNYSIGFKLSKKLKINLLYLKDFQITYFKKGAISKTNDPRAITRKKLKNVKFSNKEKNSLNRYMKKRTSGKLSHFDVKNAFGSKKNKINEFLIRKNVNLKSYSKIILLASHSLSDANHYHFEIGSRSPFKDYFSQIKETLDFAKNNKNLLFLVRPHPSSSFWKEEGLIEKILVQYKSKNIILLDNKINTDDAIRISNTVITVYGTIGLETASYYKKKPILAGRSIYSNLGFTLDSSTKDEYFKNILLNKEKFQLNKVEQRFADKALYYHFLKFNSEYDSVIANRDRNISEKKYFDDLSKYLNINSIIKDKYFQNLHSIIKKIKI